MVYTGLVKWFDPVKEETFTAEFKPDEAVVLVIGKVGESEEEAGDYFSTEKVAEILGFRQLFSMLTLAVNEAGDRAVIICHGRDDDGNLIPLSMAEAKKVATSINGIYELIKARRTLLYRELHSFTVFSIR